MLSHRATALQCVDNNGACNSVTDSMVDNESFIVVNYLGWKHGRGGGQGDLRLFKLPWIKFLS